jgi:HEAT repeats
MKSFYPKDPNAKDPVLGLIVTLSKGNRNERLEAAKSLAVIKDAKAVYALVRALEDDDHDVRWAAMKALIALNQDCLYPLLQALIKNFDSIWLREGAHHVLHTLMKKGNLSEPFVKVFNALEGIEPSVEVPWAAETAWESLKRSKKVNVDKKRLFPRPGDGSE